jgi:erythromycin esterase
MSIRRLVLCIASSVVVAACSRADQLVRPPLPPGDTVGVVDTTARAAIWLSSVAVPLATTEPGTDLTDLAPLRAMVGTARVVGLGEGTHGTREFFQLKHRVFQFLVREMGFTHFAIEATWPEANDVNEYVLTGQGDPARLLSHLYFWTWNTQEVLDLILWMRQWNTSASPSQRVQFVGFDMQFPGAAMDTVASFVGRVDPAMSAFVSNRYSCLALYRNTGSRFARAASAYAALPASQREACHQGLQEVFSLIGANGASYRSGSSDGVYENALHSARTVQQFEEMAAASASSGLAGGVRDRSMAENVQWLLQQAGPTARMMLWAHNAHVANWPGMMGSPLRAVYGADYVNLGFLFGTGSFRAIGPVGGSGSALGVWTASEVPKGSIEAIFAAAGQPLLLLDTRRIAAGGSAAAPLSGPIQMREIGAGFDPASEAAYFSAHVFPADLQLLIYVHATTASTILTFVP